MKKGDRVSFNGRVGTVVGFMPAGMVDVRMDDTGGVERRSADRLTSTVAKMNSGRPPRRVSRKPRKVARSRARFNPDEEDEEEGPTRTGRVRSAAEVFAEAASKVAITTKPKPRAAESDLFAKLPNRGAVMFTRPDPPRLSDDKRSYCGNPIDGTAYYLTVDTQSRWTQHWLTTAEVERLIPLYGGLKRMDAAGKLLPEAEALRVVVGLILADMGKQRGVNVIPKKIEPRKMQRLRGSKRGAAGPKQLLVKTLSQASELLARRERATEHSGSEPNPDTDFFLTDPETGEAEFFLLGGWKRPGPDKLKRFQAFAYRKFFLPDPAIVSRSAAEQYGVLSAALAEATRADRELAPFGIHPAVCRWLIESGAVIIELRDEGFARREPVMLPDFSDFPPGSRVTVQLKDKANSEFFSWVPSPTPMQGSSGLRRASDIALELGREEEKALRGEFALAPCLSDEDIATQKELRALKGALGGFQSAFDKTRNLFARLADQPQSLRPQDIQWSVQRLANAYAAIVRWVGRMERRRDQGDPVAATAITIFERTVLRPNDADSEISRALSALRSTPDTRGLVTSDWVRRQEPDRRKFRALIRALQRDAQEIRIIDENLGIVEWRTPPEFARGEIEDAEDLRAFMNGLRDLVLGQEGPRVREADPELAAMEVVGSFGRPGRSAVLFFEGHKPLPHPMDDLFVLVRPTLAPEAAKVLVRWRAAADERTATVSDRGGRVTGVEGLRSRDFRTWGTPELDVNRFLAEEGKAEPQPSGAAGVPEAVKRALWFSHVVGLYASGGLRRGKATLDPIMRGQTYTFQPEEFDYAQVEGLEDANWALWRVVEDVFPSLIRHGASVAEATALSRDLVLLIQLYDMLGGFNLAGPLNPNRRADSSLLRLAIKQVEDATAAVLGGRIALGDTPGKFKVYKTYNPVLFELTRLYWPSRDADTSWGSILGHEKQLENLDMVGRYGFAAAVTQHVASRARNVEEVQAMIGELVSSVPLVQDDSGAAVIAVDALVLGRIYDPQTNTMVRVPDKYYSPFMLSWPLGGSIADAANAVQQWFLDPLAYIAALKRQIPQAIGQLMIVRRHGVRAGATPQTVGTTPAAVDRARVEKRIARLGDEIDQLKAAQRAEPDRDSRRMIRDQAKEKETALRELERELRRMPAAEVEGVRREVGTTRPKGDMPFLYDDQPAIYEGDPKQGFPSSSLFRAEQAEKEQQLPSVLSFLDRAISKLGGK